MWWLIGKLTAKNSNQLKDRKKERLPIFAIVFMSIVVSVMMVELLMV